MTCHDAQPLLPLLLYGDLPADDEVGQHVASCPACRTELAALQQVRTALDSVPPPTVRIDVAALYAAAAERQSNSTRRWRRLAIASAAIAAGLLLVFALKIEVRAGDGQFVVSWSKRGHPPTATPTVIEPSSSPQDLNERLRVVQELAHALAADIDSRDERQREELASVRSRLDALQRLAADRWTETENDVTALYTAIHRPGPGENP